MDTATAAAGYNTCMNRLDEPHGRVRTVTAGSGTLGTVASGATWGAVPTYSITAPLRRDSLRPGGGKGR